MLLLVFSRMDVQAETISPWQFNASANFTYNLYNKAQQLDSQYELSAFLDGTYLDNTGLGFGYIRQSQALISRRNIVDNMVYLGGWKTYYTDSLSGLLTLYLDYYTASESVTGGGGQTPGNSPMNKPGFATSSTDIYTDSLQVINPTLQWRNYGKNLEAEISYARSGYDSTDPALDKLTVTQWAPAIAVLFNQQYDRLQLRHYGIELSNGARTAGVTSTSANELKWTHWLKDRQDGLNNFQVIILTGERFYAVDRDARKIYNLADMQTAAYTLGATWKLNPGSHFYAYGGLERYTDLDDNDDYSGGFVYLGLAQQW